MTRSLLNKNRYAYSLSSDWDRLITSFFKPESWNEAGVLSPRINASETETAYEISADLPGIQPDDVKVELLEGDLSISGKREVEEELEGKRFHRVERRVGEFHRVVTLPGVVNADKIEARFDNGVLTVLLPKSEEQLPKRIQINPSEN